MLESGVNPELCRNGKCEFSHKSETALIRRLADSRAGATSLEF